MRIYDLCHKSFIAKITIFVLALAVAQEIPEGIEPSSYSEAISCPNSSNWLLAMEGEMESLCKTETWELCQLPKGRRALTAKWIYKRKKGIPGLKMYDGEHG